MICNGKEPEKEYIYIHKHIAVYLKPTQHCKLAILQFKKSFGKKELGSLWPNRLYLGNPMTVQYYHLSAHA